MQTRTRPSGLRTIIFLSARWGLFQSRELINSLHARADRHFNCKHHVICYLYVLADKAKVRAAIWHVLWAVFDLTRHKLGS